jgi:hypothetical protein
VGSLVQMLLVIVILLIPSSVCTAERIVRVQPTPGGPQIHVSGEPVVPRWFFGSMRGGTVTANAQWSQQSFDFTTSADVSSRGTLHFRFGHKAGEVWLSDVRVFDAETGQDVLLPGSLATREAFAEVWNLWPLGDANTVGTVAVTDAGFGESPSPAKRRAAVEQVREVLGRDVVSERRACRVLGQARWTPRRKPAIARHLPVRWITQLVPAGDASQATPQASHPPATRPGSHPRTGRSRQSVWGGSPLC